MNRTLLTLAAAAAVLTGCRSEQPVAGDDITVACYYFPNYHTGDPLNELNKGEGWSEWKLVREAQPRFEGHDQPKVPLWGYTDEKDPAVMARKIEAAASHGIDVMLFDWYRYDSVPFLNRCLDEGFLKAPNVNDIRFGLMWANHDWVEIHPATHGEPQKLLYPGKVSPEAFETIGDELVRDYFTRPNYWLIDGKAYFSVYDVQKFIESFGSLEATKAAMDRLREKAVTAGLKGVHWNLVVWGNPILPVEKVPANTLELLRALGFDSATSYVWIHHCWPADTCTAYNSVRDAYMAYWDKAKAEYGVPYYPNVTMGWDPSPRTNQQKDWNPAYGYPYSGILCDNTPENFRAALQMTKDRLLADPDGPRILNINCWNEWTEGSYLEPDSVHGMKYLEAVRDVFADTKP